MRWKGKRGGLDDMKYPKPLEEGDTFELKDGVSIKHVCCDCGAVHIWEVSHSKNARITFVTVYKDRRATGQKRRHMKNKLVK